jgi:glutamate dehydrogenase
MNHIFRQSSAVLLAISLLLGTSVPGRTDLSTPRPHPAPSLFNEQALNPRALWARFTTAMAQRQESSRFYQRLLNQEGKIPLTRRTNISRLKTPRSADVFLDKVNRHIEDAANRLRLKRGMRQEQLDRVRTPKRHTEVLVSWSEDVGGEPRVLGRGGVFVGDNQPSKAKGWRITFNSPTQGGIRFAFGLKKERVQALSTDMDIKDVLMGLPLGGGKGGVDVDASAGRSGAAIARVMRGYVTAILDKGWQDEKTIAFSAQIDGGAPDYGTSPKDGVNFSEVANDERLAWLVEQGIRMVDGIPLPETLFNIPPEARGDGTKTPYLDAVLTAAAQFPVGSRPQMALLSAFTGTRPEKGGIQARLEATGLGIAYATIELLKARGILPNLRDARFTGQTTAVQGFGNVGRYAWDSFTRLGAKVVAISEVTMNGEPFALYRSGGFTGDIIQRLSAINPNPQTWSTSIDLAILQELGIEVISMERFWSLEVDIMAPCAKENVITEEVARLIKARYLVEGANGPTTYEAQHILEQNKVTVLPDVFANAGGVTVSYLNKKQNETGAQWTADDVRRQLRERIQQKFQDLLQAEKDYGVSLVQAAYILWLDERLGPAGPLPAHVSPLNPERDIEEWRTVQAMYADFLKRYQLDGNSPEKVLVNPRPDGRPVMSVLMAYPRHFSVPWSINAHMEPDKERVDRVRAARQWERLVQILLQQGIEIHLLDQAPELADMVFTANGGVVDERAKRFIPPHFLEKVRQGETPLFARFFSQRGYEVADVAQGQFWEGEGDTLVFRRFNGTSIRFGGYGDTKRGLRSNLDAQRKVAKELDHEFIGLELVNKKYYHLDTAFFPLDDGYSALYYPVAFSKDAQALIQRHIPNAIKLYSWEARYFTANGLSFGRTIVINGGPWWNLSRLWLKLRLGLRGFRVITTPMSEYMKSGGSVKCTLLIIKSTTSPWERPSRSWWRFDGWREIFRLDAVTDEGLLRRIRTAA